MKKIRFVKMHGLGNDFIIIDSRDNPDLYDNDQCNLTAQEIQLVCHRNFGIGCDQLLLIEPSTNKSADFDYHIFNQDGSKASHCGNGARCITLYLLNSSSKQQIVLNIANHLVYGCKTGNNLIKINMGFPSFNAQDVGYLGTPNNENHYLYPINNQYHHITCNDSIENESPNHIKNILNKTVDINFAIASVGNPHAIIKLDNIQQLDDDLKLTTIAQTLQNSDQFKDGVNVNFFFIDDKDNPSIHLRTFERGCGFTLACGTGACATASYSIWKNLIHSSASVLMPGGSVEIYWDKDTELQMVGAATYVFSGEMLL